MEAFAVALIRQELTGQRFAKVDFVSGKPVQQVNPDW